MDIPDIIGGNSYRGQRSPYRMPQVRRKDAIGVIGFPFSKGQPRSGAEHGPRVLREGGISEQLESLGNKVVNHGDVKIEIVPNDEPFQNSKNPRTVGGANKNLSEAVQKVLSKAQATVVLGGDHSMAIGSIHGHAQVEPDLAVIWIDAHADINTPLTSASGNIHGMPLSFLVKELQEYMPDLPGFEWCKPCISVKNIVHIGLRDVDPAERLIIEQFGIMTFSMQEIDKYGIKEVFERAMQHVDPSGTRPLHVSFDVDGMDPNLTPSTGTPVAGGMTLREGFYIAEEIAKTGRLSVLDLAEVNPLLCSAEDQQLTVKTTVDVCTKFFGGKRQGNARPNYTLPKP